MKCDTRFHPSSPLFFHFLPIPFFPSSRFSPYPVRLFFLRLVLSLIHCCLTIGYFFVFLFPERKKYVMTSEGFFRVSSFSFFLLPLFSFFSLDFFPVRETWTFQFFHDKFFPRLPFKQVAAPVKRERERMLWKNVEKEIWEKETGEKYEETNLNDTLTIGSNDDIWSTRLLLFPTNSRYEITWFFLSSISWFFLQDRNKSRLMRVKIRKINPK